MVKLPVPVVLKGGLMYYLSERSVMAFTPSKNLTPTTIPFSPLAVGKFPEKNERHAVFSQADLWNLQKHMKTIHVTDRLPRTWEGAW